MSSLKRHEQAQHSQLIVAVAVVFGLAAGAPAWANVTSPCASTVPDCLNACPGGDMAFRVTVRDFLGNLNAWESVSLDVCECPGWRICPPNGTESYSIDSTGCLISGQVANLQGVAEYRLRAGGICPSGHAQVFSGGIPLLCPPINLHPRVASPDQNGDWVVDDVDRTIASGKLGTSDLSADFDCDSLVTATDLAILGDHLGHGCASTVDVSQRPGGGPALSVPAPNPFADLTRFHYTIPKAGLVRLTVHDLQGRCVAVLVDAFQDPGSYAATWNGRGGTGGSSRAGLYFVRLDVAGVTQARKVVVAR